MKYLAKIPKTARRQPGQLGSRDPGPDRGIGPGAAAHTILRYSDATVATAPGCHPPFSTFELRIYLPGQYRSTYAAFGLEACSHAGPVYLGVEPIQPGVGTVNG